MTIAEELAAAAAAIRRDRDLVPVRIAAALHAVADWLDDLAAEPDLAARTSPGGDYFNGCACGRCRRARHAITIARAYSGRPA